jgi:hypothetical protein
MVRYSKPNQTLYLSCGGCDATTSEFVTPENMKTAADYATEIDALDWTDNGNNVFCPDCSIERGYKVQSQRA